MAQFNSLGKPLIIVVQILFSFIGVLLGFVVFQLEFSVMMTGMGIIAVAGIVVKNAIVLLDFMKHLREQGLTIDEALLEAGRTRLRPVVLTAASTVMGILPLATGIDFDWRAFHLVVGAESADFWRPLGVAIIFGLSISTFLTLVIVPTFYSLLEDWTVRIGEMVGRLRGARAPKSSPQES